MYLTTELKFELLDALHLSDCKPKMPFANSLCCCDCHSRLTTDVVDLLVVFKTKFPNVSNAEKLVYEAVILTYVFGVKACDVFNWDIYAAKDTYKLCMDLSGDILDSNTNCPYRVQGVTANPQNMYFVLHDWNYLYYLYPIYLHLYDFVNSGKMLNCDMITMSAILSAISSKCYDMHSLFTKEIPNSEAFEEYCTQLLYMPVDDFKALIDGSNVSSYNKKELSDTVSSFLSYMAERGNSYGIK